MFFLQIYVKRVETSFNSMLQITYKIRGLPPFHLQPFLKQYRPHIIEISLNTSIQMHGFYIPNSPIAMTIN